MFSLIYEPLQDSRQAWIITESSIIFWRSDSNHDPMANSPLEHPHDLRLRQRIENAN
jgi:hypothetical protein